MSAAVRTDGPWQSKHDFDRDGQLTIIGAVDGPDDGQFHYTTVCLVEEGEDATANARAISALPEVLDVLATTSRNLGSLIAAKHSDAVLMTEWKAVVDAALAKAGAR